MPDKRLRRLVTLGLGAVAAAAGGCKASPKADVPAAAEHAAPAVLQVSTEAGVDDGGGLVVTLFAPEDFPGALPVYPGSRVTLGSRRPLPGDKRAWSLTAETADAKDRVRAYYRDHLPGFTPGGEIDLGDSSLTVWRSPAYDVDLVVGRGADGTTTVTLDVAER